MNYPLQSLVIIAPIVFLVLMIGVPVIGVFAGWKRAAYWGGGTFFFFLVGVIVWKAAGTSIISGLVSVISKLLKELEITPTAKLVASVAAPVFFIGVMIIAELILLINYYAWFKRVSGIKRDVRAKKEMKAAKKQGTKAPKNLQGWTAAQFTTKGKVINKVCGGAGLALLLAPSSVTFTQAIMYTTTSVTTRATNGFCAGLYASLERTASAFSWMSYYGNADTGKDFSSLFSVLALSNKQIEFINPETGTTDKQPIVKALGIIPAGGIEKLVIVGTKVTESESTKGGQLAQLKEPINQLADNWNSLITQAQTEVTAVFQSENTTEMLESVVKKIVGEQDALKPKQILDAYGDGSVFEDIVGQIKTGYQQPGETMEITVYDGETPTSIDIKKLKTIYVSQTSFNNIKKGFMTGFNTKDLGETELEKFDTALTNIIQMVFAVK